MTAPAILKATYATWKPVPSRKILQLIFELPIEQTELAMKVLGVPTIETDTWCAIAKLVPEIGPGVGCESPAGTPSDAAQGQGKPRRHLKEMPLSSQCAIMTSTPAFIEWLGCETEAEAVDTLKQKLGISSRTALDDPTRTTIRELYQRIITSYEVGDHYVA